jgi:hypothetical protein
LTRRTAIRVAVVLGLALRLAAFLPDRSLWADEAMLALNVLDRPPARLAEPLDYNQSAPVGYLLLVKGCVSVFGPDEHAFRLVSILAAVAGLFGFAAVARRLLPGWPAAVAVALFALNPAVVSYAGEAKPYALDAAIAVGLSWLALRPDGLIELAVAGCVAVWFSNPAAFVLAGIGLGLLWRRSWWQVGLVSTSWLASFAACFLLTLRAASANHYLADYWAPHLMPWPPNLHWLVDHVLGLFDSPGGFDGLPGAAVVGLSLAGAGTVAWTRAEPGDATMVSGPAVAAFAAAAAGLYPFVGRLLLFLTPGLCLVIARGISVPGLPAVRVLLTSAVLALFGVQAVEECRHPSRCEEVKAVVQHLTTHRSSEDAVYVYYGARPAVKFYAARLGFDPTSDVTVDENRGDATELRAELDAIRARRLWVIVSHRHPGEVRAIVDHLNDSRLLVTAFEVPGAAAYLFEER